MKVFSIIWYRVHTLFLNTLKFINKMIEKLFRGSCHKCGDETGRFLVTDTDYLLKKNFLHEFKTEDEKRLAREGIGVDIKKIIEEVEGNIDCVIKSKFDALLSDINLLIDGKIAKSSIYGYLEKIEERLKELQALTNSTYLLSTNLLSEFDTESKKEQARNNLGINLNQILSDIEQLKNSVGGDGIPRSEFDALKSKVTLLESGVGAMGVSLDKVKADIVKLQADLAKLLADMNINDIASLVSRISAIESNPMLGEEALSFLYAVGLAGAIAGKMVLRDGAFVLDLNEDELTVIRKAHVQFIAENTTDQPIPVKSLDNSMTIEVPARSWSIVRFQNSGNVVSLVSSVGLGSNTSSGGSLKGVYSTYIPHMGVNKYWFRPSDKGIVESENDFYIIQNKHGDGSVYNVDGTKSSALPASTTGVFRFYNNEAELLAKWPNFYLDKNEVFATRQFNLESSHVSGGVATLKPSTDFGEIENNAVYVTQNLTDVPGKIVDGNGLNPIDVAPGETILYTVVDVGEWDESTPTPILKARIRGSVSSGSGVSYTLPVATESTLGGVKVGAPLSEQFLPVKLNESNQAYVDVNEVKSKVAASIPQFEVISQSDYAQKQAAGQLSPTTLYFVQ